MLLKVNVKQTDLKSLKATNYHVKSDFQVYKKKEINQKLVCPLGVHLNCVLELTKNNIQYGQKDNLNRTPLEVAFDVSKRIDDGRKPELQQIIDKLSIYRYE